MVRRTTATLALLSLLFVFAPIMPSMTFEAEGTDDVSSGADDIIEIDLGIPVFDLNNLWLDGRFWSTIGLVDGLHPPTSGTPSVPVIQRTLKMDREIVDVTLSREGPVMIRLPGKLPPSPTPLVLDASSVNKASPLEPDWDRYGDGTVYPEEPLLWTRIGWSWEGEQRIGHYSISASPFDYNPSTDTLTAYTDLKLTVTLGDPEITSEDETTRSGTRAFDLPPHVQQGTELLVISADSFQDDLSAYVEWNREKGTCVSVVSISQVDAQFPDLDKTGSIWQYIHDTFFGDEKNLKYVLLAGEVSHVPSRMVKDLDPYGSEPSTLPGDTYFACLDGTYRNWNADGDANWGEMNDIQDYYPEVFVSRISLDSETEAKKWSDKVVRYEKDAPVGNWAGTMAFFGSTTHYTDDGPKQSEYLWSKHGRYAYSSIDRYYSDGPTRSSTGASLLNFNNVQTGFGEGLSAVVYMGHGLAQYWSEGTQENSKYLYDANVAANLDQSPRMPFITAMSCETNWFDGSGWEAISEGFTENPNGGAIAYVGASRTTEGGIGYDTYLPGAPGIQEDVLRMMANGYRTPAEIFHRAKAYYVENFINYFASNQFAYNAWMEHNLLGPPETPLWMSTPNTFNVAYSFDDDHYTNFTVQVQDGSNNAVQNARVTVYSGTLEQRSYTHTDAQGRAEVPFTISQTAYAKLTVTKEDFKPYQKEVLLRDQTPPEIEPLCEVPNPNGANGWYVTDPGLSLSSSEPADISYIWNGRYTENYRGGTMEVPVGDNTLEFWGEDGSGNEEDVRSFRVKYDPDTPMASITLTPGEPDGTSGWFITQPVVTVVLEPSPGSPQRVDYWWDRGQKKECNGTIYPPQGDSELHVQAVDEAGNRGPEFMYEFSVDSIVPVTGYDTGGVEPNERGWYTDPMSITLRSDDRRSYTYYRWGSEGEWKKYSSELIPLSGNHTLYYYSEDDHGNREQMRTFQVPYDIMAPEVEISTTPMSPNGESNWYVTKPRVELDVLFENNDYDIFYQFDGEELARYISPIDIPEGEWKLYCFAEDEAGNRGMVRETEFKVDLTPEMTSSYQDLSTNEEGWFTELPQIILTTSEGTRIYYSWEGLTGFEQYFGSLYPPGDEGVFHLTYYSVDRAGNEESRKMLTLLVDTTAPIVSVEMPKSAGVEEEIGIDLSGTTDGIGVESYFVDYGDGTDSGWTVKPVLTHKYTAGGTYKVSVKARDAAGHESPETVIELSIEEDPSATMLALVLGGGAIILIILIALVVVIIVRPRHHHYPHHGIHHHPLHPLGPGYGPTLPQGAQHALPPPSPQHTQRAPQPPPGPPVRRSVPGPANVPQPPKRPEIPKPPRPPI